MLQISWGQNANANNKYDADGDGVEDNIDLNSGQIDRFIFPNVFSTAVQGIFNTRHGNMPGEKQAEFDETETEPEDKWMVVNHEWQKW